MIDFTPLIEHFAQLHAQATDLKTPNPEDYHRIRLAMIGYSRSADIALWDIRHFQFIQNRLDTDLPPDDFSDAWIDFACLALGYLLGLADSGQIETDSDFGVADAQLPGFMWMHSATIEQMNTDAGGT